MALTVETGEGLANADSLVSLAEVRAFASARGKTLPEADAVLEQQIRAAHDYLVLVEDRLQGSRRKASQALPFPRSGICLYGESVEDDVIPVTLKNAVAQLVIESQTRDALPVNEGRVVTQESVGPLSTSYAITGSSNPSFPRVDAYLLPLLKSGSALLTSIRV